jgi:ribosomal protein S20
MPQRKTSVQDMKKSRARQMHNLDIKTDLRKTTKLFIEALAKGAAEAQKALNVFAEMLLSRPTHRRARRLGLHSLVVVAGLRAACIGSHRVAAEDLVSDHLARLAVDDEPRELA